jgi:hypothetical protein
MQLLMTLAAQGIDLSDVAPWDIHAADAERQLAEMGKQRSGSPTAGPATEGLGTTSRATAGPATSSRATVGPATDGRTTDGPGWLRRLFQAAQ